MPASLDPPAAQKMATTVAILKTKSVQRNPAPERRRTLVPGKRLAGANFGGRKLCNYRRQEAIAMSGAFDSCWGGGGTFGRGSRSAASSLPAQLRKMTVIQTR